MLAQWLDTVMESRPVRFTRLISAACRRSCRFARPTTRDRAAYSTASQSWSNPPSWTNVAEDEIAKLAAIRRRPLTLGDLLK